MTKYVNRRKIPFNLRFELFFLTEVAITAYVLIFSGILLYLLFPTLTEVRHDKYRSAYATIDKIHFDTSNVGGENYIYYIDYYFKRSNDTIRGSGYVYSEVKRKAGDDIGIKHRIANAHESAVFIDFKAPNYYTLIFLWMTVLVGLVFLSFHFSRSLKYYRLIKYGFITIGKVLYYSSKKSGFSGKPLFRVCYKYTDNLDFEHENTQYTKQLKKLTDEKKEIVLYNPRNPLESVLVDALPGNMKRYVANFPEFFDKLPV